MKAIKEKKTRQKEENRKKKNKEKKLPGYPKYPADEDIYVRGKRTDAKLEDDHQPSTNLSEKEQPSKTPIDETDLNVDDTIITNIQGSDSFDKTD
ncbi:MAG TPA: hypothetical protein VIM65_15265 [Cyclobacteriaceae bacterium]